MIDISSPPHIVHIEVTEDCNLRCPHCYLGEVRHPGRLSLPEVTRLVEEVRLMGGEYAVLSGGEFFLHPEWRQMLEVAKALAVRCRVLTNGVSLRPEVYHDLCEQGLVAELRFSLDGLSHDEVRGTGTMDAVVKAIRACRGTPARVVVNTVALKPSISTLPEFYDLVGRLGVVEWRVDFPFCAGRMIRNGELFTEEDLAEAVSAFGAIVEKYERHSPRMLLDLAGVFKSRCLAYGFARLDLSSHPCEYMQNSCTVRATGDVGWCPSLPIVFGSIRDQPLRAILVGESRRRFLDLSVHSLVSCRGCKYLPLCQGGCRADAWYEGGGILERDPRSCAVMEQYAERILPRLGPLMRRRLEEAGMMACFAH